MSNDPIQMAIDAIDRLIKACEEDSHPNDWRTPGDGTPLGDAREALTALRQHQQDGGWLPIETAPKDGTRILAFVPPYGAMSANFSEALSPIVNGRWNCHGSLNREAIPTLWQPLPPAPKKENNELNDNGFSGIPIPVETVADALGVSTQDVIIRAIADPENQPHQFVGDPEGLKAALTAPDQSELILQRFNDGKRLGILETEEHCSETIKALVKALEMAKQRIQYLGAIQGHERHHNANERDFIPVINSALAMAEEGGA